MGLFNKKGVPEEVTWYDKASISDLIAMREYSSQRMLESKDHKEVWEKWRRRKSYLTQLINEEFVFLDNEIG